MTELTWPLWTGRKLKGGDEIREPRSAFDMHPIGNLGSGLVDKCHARYVPIILEVFGGYTILARRFCFV